jgi:hypothetical protein
MIRLVTREPSFAVLLSAAWLFCFILTAGSWNLSTMNLVDSDDALRLLQVRDFLAGQGWFDLHQPRLGPVGYDSHWSRLIDAGLAGFISVFHVFLSRDAAEALTAIVWPVLWLAPTMAGAAAIAWRIGGREAAVIALLLCVFGLPGFQQFKPGRIDHHNVQIALAVLVVAATVWSDRLVWAACAAGVLTGLALAIGLESLLFLALAGAAFALRYAVDPRAAPALRAYGLSVGASAVYAFFVSVGPDHWARSMCDQIAINYVAAIVVGGLGLALASLSSAERGWMRWGAVTAAGGAALALFVLFAPRCLAGPYGQIDPAIIPILLAEVAEMQSLPRMLSRDLAAGVATAAFPAVGLLAALMVAVHTQRYRDFGVLTAAAASLVACAIAFVAFKGYPYAMWLGVPFVAAAAVDLFHRFRLTGLVPRFVAALVVTPITISLTAMSIAAATSSGRVVAGGTPDRQACKQKQSYQELARLPKGLLVANELEWGSFLLLWTPHSVLGAPYHRLSDGIVMTHEIFARPPEQSRAALARAHADYVVTCGQRGAAGLLAEERPGSLWARLSAGEIPEWLERVAETDGQAVAVYRVKY